MLTNSGNSIVKAKMGQFVVGMTVAMIVLVGAGYLVMHAMLAKAGVTANVNAQATGMYWGICLSILAVIVIGLTIAVRYAGMSALIFTRFFSNLYTEIANGHLKKIRPFTDAEKQAHSKHVQKLRR